MLSSAKTIQDKAKELGEWQSSYSFTAETLALANAVVSLDAWLLAGGALPESWRSAKPQAIAKPEAAISISSCGQYKVLKNVYYHRDTPDQVCFILEQLYQSEERVAITFGNTDTGQPWPEDQGQGPCDRGRIGRTTGMRSPILVKTKRSLGGELITTQCILQVRLTTGRLLYQHHNYKV